MYTLKSNVRHSNYDVNQTLTFKMLSENQCEEIYATACELLEHVGAAVASEEARKIFAENGCWVEGEMVRIPSAKLEWAIRTAPSRVTLFGRDGKRAVMMETENVHFGPGHSAEQVVDRKNGTPRDFTYQDLVDAARLFDQLENVNFICAPGVPVGTKKGAASLAGLEALLTYSNKPIVQPVSSGWEAEKAALMTAAAAGGADRLRRDPSLILSIECSESRYHSEEALSAVMYAAGNGIPFIYQNKLVAGQTAPASTAATLALALANTLVAVTLSQFICAGAPVIASGCFTIMDDKNGMVPFGAPEANLMSAGFANLMHWLRIPNAGISGISDSVISDAQSGIELTLGLLSSALGGTNLIGGGGLLEGGKQFSFPVLTMSDEVMSLIYRMMSSLEVDEDRIAVGVYDEVGPGGNYLGEDHTSVFFKKEQLWPNLFQRLRIDDWIASGSKPLGQRALEYAERLLAAPATAVIDEAAISKVKAVLSAAEAEL